MPDKSVAMPASVCSNTPKLTGIRWLAVTLLNLGGWHLYTPLRCRCSLRR